MAFFMMKFMMEMSSFSVIKVSSVFKVPTMMMMSMNFFMVEFMMEMSMFSVIKVPSIMSMNFKMMEMFMFFVIKVFDGICDGNVFFLYDVSSAFYVFYNAFDDV